VNSATLLQIIGVTLFGGPATNRGGILIDGENSRLAAYSTVFEQCRKSADDGGAIRINTAKGVIGSGVKFLNCTASGDGGAVSSTDVCMCLGVR